jgi:UDP-glucose 4-epimerase
MRRRRRRTPSPKGGEVAVIGGSGFIGSRLAAALVEIGANVTVLDLEAPPPAVEARCCFDRVDIREPGDLEGSLDRVDAVFLTAGRLAKLCNEDPRDGWAVNALGARNVVNELATNRRRPRVVFTSTGTVYRSPAPVYPTPESAPVEARDTYTASKIDAERTIACAARRGLVSATVLRPFTVYGAGPAAGARGHFVASWIERAVTGQPLVVHGDGAQTVDLTHVDDLVRACLAALNTDLQFSVFNVGSNTETTILEIAGWICEVLPALEVVSTPSQGGPRRQFADIRLANQRLGWRPHVRPRDGINELLRGTLGQLELVPDQ